MTTKFRGCLTRIPRCIKLQRAWENLWDAEIIMGMRRQQCSKHGVKL